MRLDIRITEAQEQQLLEGVEIGPGGLSRFSDLRFFRGGASNYWYHLVLMEGRNRQVRRLFEAVGARVSRLKRVRFGPVILSPGLLAGRYRALSGADTTELFRILGLPRPKVWRSCRPGDRAARKGDRGTVLIPYPELTSV